MANNERLKDLSIKLGCFMLDKMNQWSLADIRKAIAHYDAGTGLNPGVAQFLRLYLAARTIGAVTKERNAG